MSTSRDSRLSTTTSGNDPVCLRIEIHLTTLATDGHARLERKQDSSGIHLRFGNFSSSAETYEIALVRLASNMLDDERYSRSMAAALRDVMRRQS